MSFCMAVVSAQSTNFCLKFTQGLSQNASRGVNASSIEFIMRTILEGPHYSSR